MKNALIYKTLIFLLTLAVYGCQQNPEKGSQEHLTITTQSIDDNRLIQANQTPEDWLSYGRNYQEDRFSQLSQINKNNIEKLGLAWSVNLGVKRGIEATPLVVDGIMYVTGNYSVLYAIDARKGEIIWKYDPGVPRLTGIKACCGTVNRGAALYKGLVFVGALDGRLIAVDAVTGEEKWSVQTTDPNANYTITGAPRVVDGKVIIGNGGAELGVRGFVTAYDAMTGKQIWRTYTVPGDPSKPFESKAMEEAAKTWTGKWWEYGGGGTAWDAMAYDPDLNLLYIGVGNGSPWPRIQRSPEGGDNLYLSSIIALNPQDGKLVWYYQTTPGDNWDYTATQHLILADLTIEGVERKVIMQAPKNGFFYVIDRTNGKFISAKPYVYTNWASSIDPTTGKPVENDWGNYDDKDIQIFPSPIGGHNWPPMSFNPQTGLVYIPAQEFSAVFTVDPNWEFNGEPGAFNLGIIWGGKGPKEQIIMDDDAPVKKPTGRLIAWDPVKQKEVWRASYDKAWFNGGTLTTAGGLVFQGVGDGHLMGYEADSGKKLWETDLKTGILAPPITYELDGVQYISVAVGWGAVMGSDNQFTEYNNPGTVYTFALDKNTPYPDYPKPAPKKLADFPFEEDEKLLANGGLLYLKNCSHCHRQIARETGGAIPDLGYIAENIYNSFEDIVLGGILEPNGMPSFKGILSKDEVLSVRSFIISQSKKKLEGEDQALSAND